MGGFKPIPLEQLPIPQAAAPQQYKPAQMDQPPVGQQPYGTGAMSPGGKIADIGSNFLNGWLKGKQRSEEHKLAMAQQSVSGSQYAFQIAQQNAQQVMNDPNATDQQKQQAETARQAAWKGYLDVADQYTQQPKGAKGSGGKGQGNGIKDHLKSAFGAEDPHIFAQASMALLRKTGPPALQQRTSQDKLADFEVKGVERQDQAVEATTAAHKDLVAAQQSGDPAKIAEAQKKFDASVENLNVAKGQPQDAETRRKNMLSQAAIDTANGKPVSPEMHAQMQAAGYEPAPILPNTFERTDDKGIAWADSIDPVTHQVTHTQLGKTRIPPDQRADANAIFKDNMKNYEGLIRRANPDWTDQQVASAMATALGAGAFKMKGGSAAAGLSPIQSTSEVSKAINQVYAQLSPDEQKKADAVLMQQKGVPGGGPKGGWMFRDDLGKTTFLDKYNPFKDTYGGMSKEEAGQYQSDLRGQVRAALKTNLKLSKPKMSDAQLDTAIDEMMGEQPGSTTSASPARAMDPTPGGEAKTATMADVQAFAKANNMSIDEAKTQVTAEGYSVVQ